MLSLMQQQQQQQHGAGMPGAPLTLAGAAAVGEHAAAGKSGQDLGSQPKRRHKHKHKRKHGKRSMAAGADELQASNHTVQMGSERAGGDKDGDNDDDDSDGDGDGFACGRAARAAVHGVPAKHSGSGNVDGACDDSSSESASTSSVLSTSPQRNMASSPHASPSTAAAGAQDVDASVDQTVAAATALMFMATGSHDVGQHAAHSRHATASPSSAHTGAEKKRRAAGGSKRRGGAGTAGASRAACQAPRTAPAPEGHGVATTNSTARAAGGVTAAGGAAKSATGRGSSRG